VIKSYRLPGAILFVLICMAGTPVHAADTADRQYALTNHGSLQLQVPTSWKEELHQDSDHLLPTIVFTPTSGAPFGVVVTPIRPTGQDAPNLDHEALRKLVRDTAEEVKAQTVEQTIEVLELQGASGVGYYFSVTDRAPKTGGYKHLTQGLLPVGILTVAFAIYTNDGQQDIVTHALTMLKSANHAAGNSN
jgi:hypothetical protein